MSLDFSIMSWQTCPKCSHQFADKNEVPIWSRNITHNLGGMANEAGLYKLIWRPEENGISTAGQLIEPLEKGIADMEADPERFKRHNAENGWGMYEHFLPWLKDLLAACKANPGAAVEASR